MGLRSEVDQDRTRTVENRLGNWTGMRCEGLMVMDRVRPGITTGSV